MIYLLEELFFLPALTSQARRPTPTEARPARLPGWAAIGACKVHPNLGLSCSRILESYQAYHVTYLLKISSMNFQLANQPQIQI